MEDGNCMTLSMQCEVLETKAVILGIWHAKEEAQRT
jgi:hypothetical protein